ncbi:MAG: serine hydrolase domain-containing protein [Pseudomonadota bacterium]
MFLKRSSFCALMGLISLLPAAASAQLLYSEDFQGGDAAGWQSGGEGTVSLSTYADNTSLQLTNQSFALIALKVEGPPQVRVSANFAASDLERKDACIAEVSTDGGASWDTILSVTNGMDDGVTLHAGQKTIDIEKPEVTLAIRLRVAGNADNDSCWADNIRVTALRPLIEDPQPSTRQDLSFEWLQDKTHMPRPVLMSAFAPPADARAPTATFEGLLSVSAKTDSGGLDALRDSFNFLSMNLPGLATIPDFAVHLVQDDNRLIPQERGLIRMTESAWDLIVQPGLVWSEAGDRGFNRATLPIALQEVNANCTHNGVLTFLFNEQGETSGAAFQIVSETCSYFQYDMWGLAEVDYEPQPVASKAALIANDRQHRSTRNRSKPISTLAQDHLGLDMSAFGSPDDISPEHMTRYGVIIDGIDYWAGCQTRYGVDPFCEEKVLPSYSLAKSIFAGLSLMRLEVLYPGVSDTLIKDYVPACHQDKWDGVTFEHALDMATGHYNTVALEADENAAVLDGFFLVESHAEKIDRACKIYPKRDAPGETFVYHTTAHYVLGTAMQAFLREQTGEDADIYKDLLVDPLWTPLDLSPVLKTTRRTRDAERQPFVGWGLSFTADDLVKLAQFIAIDEGQFGGTALIDRDSIKAALQRDPDNSGLKAKGTDLGYKAGFWFWDVQDTLQCRAPKRIPFMSGFGGLSVVIMPNDVIYYYISDNAEFKWSRAVSAAHRYRPICEERS